MALGSRQRTGALAKQAKPFTSYPNATVTEGATRSCCRSEFVRLIADNNNISLGRNEGLFERLKRSLRSFNFMPVDESGWWFDLFALNIGESFGKAAPGSRWSRSMSWTTTPATSKPIASAPQRKAKSILVPSRAFCSPARGCTKEIEVTLWGIRSSESHRIEIGRS